MWACGAVCPPGGRGYYKVEVLYAGSGLQFGFCSPEWSAEDCPSSNGVGDDGPSWAVDGDRVLKWHEGEDSQFGSRWRAGDVVGLACDLREGRMLASLNGDFAPPYGTAFDLPAGLPGLCPALSAGLGLFQCRLGGLRPFRFAPPSPDYQPMASFAAQAGLHLAAGAGS